MNWISIEDKMPPNKSYVLACFKFKMPGMNWEQIMKLCYYDYTSGFGVSGDKDIFHQSVHYVVTHWMLSPEYPPLEIE